MSDTQITRATRKWVLDLERSTVEFRVPNFWGLTTVAGRFTRFDGSYAVTPDERTAELRIEAGSLDTGNRRRDEHLRSDAFFDAGPHPYVSFTTHDVAGAGTGKLRVHGVLEAAGRTASLSFEAQVRTEGGELEIEASAELDQRVLGMTFSPLGVVRTPTTLHVKARLTR